MGALKEMFSKSVEGDDGSIGDELISEYKASAGEFSANGDSPEEAIGSLIIEHGEELGITIKTGDESGKLEAE